MSPEERERLKAIIRERSYRSGQFTLASGRTSTQYFNLKPTMMDPEGAHLCAVAALALLDGLGAELVGGVEMGAVPIASAMAALSFAQGRPVRTFFIRKAAKTHGTKEVIEGLAPGESVAGRRVVVLEDVTTSGGSALKAVQDLREAGAIVIAVVSILDRGEGAAAAFAAEGIALRSAVRASEFT